jgi:hypothetical protein
MTSRRDDLLLAQERDAVVVFSGLVYSASWRLEPQNYKWCTRGTLYTSTAAPPSLSVGEVLCPVHKISLKTSSSKYNDDITLLI